MLEPVLRCFFVFYYFFYYLIQGKEEWRHKNTKPTSGSKPAIATCCQENPPPSQSTVAHESFPYSPTSPKPYQTQKPYAFSSESSGSSWLERWFPGNGKIRRYGGKIWECLKVVPSYLWRGLKWLFWTVVGFFAYLGRSFLNIFWSQSVDESGVFGEPKTYTYRRIEPPKDYREVEELEGVEEIEPPTKPIDEANKEEQKEPMTTEQDLIPMSFYTRKQSLPGIRASPAPPAPPPPPPDKPVRIPSSLDLASKDTESELRPEEKAEKLKAEGAIPVLPPSLMEEAKQAALRRSKTPTSFVKQQQAEENSRLQAHGVVTQLPPSNEEPDESRYVFKTRKHSMPDYMLSERNHSREIRKEQSMPREGLRDRPNDEERGRREVHEPHQQAPRWQNASPAPYLLGRPVFTPVDEVERIRDRFNRRTESRATSVAAFSREPSIPPYMTSSYHADYGREKTASPIVTFRDSSVDAPPSVRHRFPTSTPKPWHNQGGWDSSQVKWAIRRTNEDDLLSRIPLSSRRVVERKITEKHYEKDADGQLMTGWRETNWMGHMEEANEAGKVTFKQAYETSFQNARPI